MPVGRHPATFAEIHEAFVVNAPFRPRRELIFRALTLYADLVGEVYSTARLWIDGGFVTLKQWAAPEDADVVVVVPLAEYVAKAGAESNLPLLTLQGVFSTKPNASTAKLHPMGGLLDSFIQPDIDVMLAPWDLTWMSVKDENGLIVPGQAKGYLEVAI